MMMRSSETITTTYFLYPHTLVVKNTVTLQFHLPKYEQKNHLNRSSNTIRWSENWRSNYAGFRMMVELQGPSKDWKKIKSTARISNNYIFNAILIFSK